MCVLSNSRVDELLTWAAGPAVGGRSSGCWHDHTCDKRAEPGLVLRRLAGAHSGIASHPPKTPQHPPGRKEKKYTCSSSSGHTVGPSLFARLTAVERLRGRGGALSLLRKKPFIVKDLSRNPSCPLCGNSSSPINVCCLEHLVCCQINIVRELKTNS